MALTRKFLSALGIEADKVDEIIEAHTETVNGLKADRDKYKEDAEKLPSIQKELDELKKAKEGEDPYQKKFEDLQKEFDDYKADIEAKNTTAKKEKALKDILKEIGVSDKVIENVIKVSDTSKIEFDDKGEVKGKEDLKKSLSSEWSGFIATKKNEGANSANPPANNGNSTMTKEQIRAISDPVARQKAMLENPTLFGLPEATE
jgi:uncharacterized protein YlxW (UPF0749 family)